MNVNEFTAIANAAGINLSVRGSRSAYARALGVYPAQVSNTINNGVVGDRVAQAASDLSASILDGTYTPGAPVSFMGPGKVSADALPTDPEDSQTDEQILDTINRRFKTMDRFVQFACKGKLRCVLVTGPGGIGKTYPVEVALEDYQSYNPNKTVVCVTGSMSAVGFVEACWNTRGKGDVLLIDDADSGFKGSNALEFSNVFKAATDTKGRRVISWLKKSKALEEAGVDPQFEYEGTVIVISNSDMKSVADGTSAMAGHMDAILSRSHHIDLGINSSRALALRVNDMILRCRMLDQKFALAGMPELADKGAEDIAEFITENRDNFRSLTLREAAKVADIYIACEGDDDWSDMALLSCGSL